MWAGFCYIKKICKGEKAMEKTTKTIAIANQKGGVGKTTSTVNLAGGLVRRGKKVLCLDWDYQCNLATYLDHKVDCRPTVTDYVIAKASYMEMPPVDGLIRHSMCGIDYIPSSLRLAQANEDLLKMQHPDRVLRDILTEIIPEEYNYVLIDCTPSMNKLLVNGLVAADKVLIPVQTEDFAVNGLEDMMDLIDTIRTNINPNLEILGLLPTLVANNRDSREVIEYLHKEYPALTFGTYIGRYVDASHSVKIRKPLISAQKVKKSKATEQYMAAADELLHRLEG